VRSAAARAHGPTVVGILLALSAPTAVHAYSATADVTFTWGNANGTQIAWTSSGANTLAAFDNDTYLHTLTGNNSTAYFNSDFAAASDGDGSSTGDDCLTPPAGYDTIALRKYGCRISDVAVGYYSPLFNYQPLQANAVTSAGPLPAATGTLTVNDTSLTGTLTVISTTDLPTGGRPPAPATAPTATTCAAPTARPSATSGTASRRRPPWP